MSDLIAARSQMGLSLAFHIAFAAFGMAMPFFMAVSHSLWIRSRNPIDLELSRMWAKGVAILFATGAVSGTVISFELGLLWPVFMRFAGPVIGMPFSWEGAAFFTEAVALGFFLYGSRRLPPWAHWLSGVIVGISGFISGIFILSANAWMNSPSGFDWVQGQATNIDPIRAMFNPAWAHYAIHMGLAAFEAVGFAVAGIHAFLLLKKHHKGLHTRALRIALFFGASAAILQPLSGDYSAKWVARHQPAKLAAAEALFETQKGAPIMIAGWPDVEKHKVRFGYEVPMLLSFLATGRFNGEVKGLNDIPAAEWPPVAIVHIAFQIMVAVGFGLAAISAYFGLYQIFGTKLDLPRWYMRLLVFCTPLGLLAMEAGWTVTEVGRQPWILYKILKTADAVTPMKGLVFHFGLFLLIYLFLAFVVSWIMSRQIIASNRLDEKLGEAK